MRHATDAQRVQIAFAFEPVSSLLRLLVRSKNEAVDTLYSICCAENINIIKEHRP
jgi:hypothetical protein